MSGKQFDQLDITDCDRLTRDYVCAQCWGSLIYEVVRGKPPKDIKFIVRIVARTGAL